MGRIVVTYGTHFMSSIFRVSKHISGLVKVEVYASLDWLMKSFVNVEPCYHRYIIIKNPLFAHYRWDEETVKLAQDWIPRECGRLKIKSIVYWLPLSQFLLSNKKCYHLSSIIDICYKPFASRLHM